MSETAIAIIALVIFAVLIIGWLLYLAAGLVLVFTAFVMKLPTILAIIMFILCPPTLIVFLVGLAFIHFGIADRLAGSNSDQSTGVETTKLSKRDMEKERERRRALGYDE